MSICSQLASRLLSMFCTGNSVRLFHFEYVHNDPWAEIGGGRGTVSKYFLFPLHCYLLSSVIFEGGICLEHSLKQGPQGDLLKKVNQAIMLGPLEE